jgi:hypothetical protein
MRTIRNLLGVALVIAFMVTDERSARAIGDISCGDPYCHPMNPHQMEVYCTFDNNVYDPQSMQFLQSCYYARFDAANHCFSYDPFAMELEWYCDEGGLPYTAASGEFVCAWYNDQEC